VVKGMKSNRGRQLPQRIIKWPFFCVHGGKCAVANDERPHFLEKQRFLLSDEYERS
jgi:hypothetical protein